MANQSLAFTRLPAFNMSTEEMECLAGNPWCKISQEQKVIEVFYLLLISIVGTFGNVLVIVSIVLENRTYRFGNVFIINLAFADFVVSIKIISILIF